MRAINVINVEKNEVKSIETFPIWEEDFSEDIINDAKVHFIKEMKKALPTITDDFGELCYDIGIYFIPNGSISVVVSHFE